MFTVQNLLWNLEKTITLSVDKLEAENAEEKSKPEKEKFVKKTSVTKKRDAKKRKRLRLLKKAKGK